MFKIHQDISFGGVGTRTYFYLGIEHPPKIESSSVTSNKEFIWNPKMELGLDKEHKSFKRHEFTNEWCRIRK